MATVKYGYLDTEHLDDIGAAIREKNGETDKYTISQMPDKIRAIETTPTPSIPVSETITPGSSTTIPAGYYETAGSVSASSANTLEQIDDTIKETTGVTATLKNSIDVTPSDGKVLIKVTVNPPDMSDATVTTLNLVRGVTAYDANGSLITGVHDEQTLEDMTADATASESDLLPGKTAYAKGAKITGTMTGLDATSYNPSDIDQTISAGQYLSGVQTIVAVTADNLPLSLKETKTVTAPISGSTTFTPSSGKVLTAITVNSADTTGTATASDILSGKTAYVNGEKVTGTIGYNETISKTIVPGGSTTISKGFYADDGTVSASLASTTDQIDNSIKESQTVTASLTESVSVTPTTGKVLTGVTVNKPDMSSATATASDIMTGKTAYGSDGTLLTGTGTGGIDTSDATAEEGDIVKGKTAYVKGEKITGTLSTVTLYTSTEVPSSTVGEAGDICIITS